MNGKLVEGKGAGGDISQVGNAEVSGNVFTHVKSPGIRHYRHGLVARVPAE